MRSLIIDSSNYNSFVANLIVVRHAAITSGRARNNTLQIIILCLCNSVNRTRIYSYLFNIPTNCLRAKRVTIANRHCTQSTYMTSWAQLCMPLDRIENISPVLTLSSLVGYISYVMSWVSKIILVAPIFFLYAPAICPQNLTC